MKRINNINALWTVIKAKKVESLVENGVPIVLDIQIVGDADIGADNKHIKYLIIYS